MTKMNEKTYYVNQVPVESIVFTVVDEQRNARSLAAYTSASVYFTSPDGTIKTGGDAVITDSANGKVTYTFPEATVFDQRGAYRMQLKLINGNREDYADILSIRVIDPLEGVGL
jgi:hypothetical protein